MAGNENHLVGNHLAGNRRRLPGIAGIVADLQLELLAVHAARRVDIVDRHGGAAPELFAERGILARHRTGQADLDLSEGRGCH